MTLTACSPAACRSACGNSSRGDPVDLWIGTAREGTARTFGTGIAAAEEGWLSLTPIHLDMTHAAGLAALEATLDQPGDTAATHHDARVAVDKRPRLRATFLKRLSFSM